MGCHIDGNGRISCTFTREVPRRIHSTRRVGSMGFQRDNVLSRSERDASARKCLALLDDCASAMNAKELGFVEDMPEKIEQWGCTEPQLQWLRDLVSKYVT